MNGRKKSASIYENANLRIRGPVKKTDTMADFSQVIAPNILSISSYIKNFKAACLFSYIKNHIEKHENRDLFLFATHSTVHPAFYSVLAHYLS